jgi:hypothetical protein
VITVNGVTFTATSNATTTLASAQTRTITDLQNPMGKITGFEELDINGLGGQSLLLNTASVFNFSDTSDLLKIHGGVGDSLTLSGNWIPAGTQPVIYEGGAARQYDKYTYYDAATQTTATILINPDVALTIAYVGGSGDDVRTFDPSDLTVDGGAGTDTLRLDTVSAADIVLDLGDTHGCHPNLHRRGGQLLGRLARKCGRGQWSIHPHGGRQCRRQSVP